MQLHVSLCGTTVVGSSLENSALSGKLELKLRSHVASSAVLKRLSASNVRGAFQRALTAPIAPSTSAGHVSNKKKV